MQKYVKKQIRTIYGISALEVLHIAGASWVALLAARGFSVFEIGILESIFHVVSMCFEIPSGGSGGCLWKKEDDGSQRSADDSFYSVHALLRYILDSGGCNRD